MWTSQWWSIKSKCLLSFRSSWCVSKQALMRSGGRCLSMGDDHKISQCSCQGAKMYNMYIYALHSHTKTEVGSPTKDVCVCVNLYADMMTLTTLIFLRCDDIDSPWGRYLQLISTPFFAASLQTEGLVLHQTNLQRGEGGRNGTPWAAEIESLFASAASLNHLSNKCASNKKPSICIHPHHFCPW